MTPVRFSSVILVLIALVVLSPYSVALVWWVRGGQDPGSAFLIASSVGATTIAAVSAAGVWFTVREMRQDRIERAQPLVLVEFRPGSGGLIYCTVQNHGTGVALDVALEFDPVPIDVHGTPVSEWPMFQSPIPTIVPGERYVNLFHTGFELFNGNTALVFSVVASYKDEFGNSLRRQYQFDLGRYKGTSIPRKSEADQIGALVEIAKRWERTARDDSPYLRDQWNHLLQRQRRRARLDAMMKLIGSKVPEKILPSVLRSKMRGRR